jgi:hypothetical protein
LNEAKTLLIVEPLDSTAYHSVDLLENVSLGPTSQVTTLAKDLLPWYETDLRTGMDHNGGERTLDGLCCQESTSRGSDGKAHGSHVQQPKGHFVRLVTTQPRPGLGEVPRKQVRS